MTTGDWEEVKRLAADFQRAQLTSTAQTLSERNCVEIISHLIESNLLEVIFTTDGREYVTPQYLLKEIKDELYVSGGRINLVELAKTLNVDLSHINARIPEIEKSSGCTIIMGQLINRTYQKTIAEEINDRLQRDGHLTIADLTKIYDLPGDFLLNVVERNLGKIIKAKQDKSESRVFFTAGYLERCKGLLRGALRALTRPTQLAALLAATGLEERDFYYTFDCLTEERQSFGSLTARQGNGLFVPSVYTKQQTQWVQDFYKQNGYLEYDALSRLGISEPASFVRRNYRDTLELSSCAVSPQLLDQIHAAVEEAYHSSSYLDLMMVVPSVFSPGDVRKVLEVVLKRPRLQDLDPTSSPSSKSSPAKTPLPSVPLLFGETFLVSEGFVSQVLQPFSESGLIERKAKEAVSDGSFVQLKIDLKLSRGGGGGAREKSGQQESGPTDRKEERRKKASSGRSGGGTQGRETKTKGVQKKKARGRRDSGGDSDSDTNTGPTSERKLELFSIQEVEAELKNNKNLEELEDGGVLQELAEHILPILNKDALELTSRLWEESLVAAGTGGGGGTAGERRAAVTALESQLEGWLLELRLSGRSIGLFDCPETRARLEASVLRAVGTQLVNHIFSYATAQPGGSPVDPDTLTAQSRLKLLSMTSGETGDGLAALHRALTGGLQEFLQALDRALSLTGLLGKRPDKKKEKQLLMKRREQLLGELAAESTPALVLQQSCLLLFQSATGSLLNVSGKFVPTILAFLQSHLTPEDYASLRQYQDKLLQLLSVDSEETAEELKLQLNAQTDRIKEIATTYKKPTSASKES